LSDLPTKFEIGNYNFDYTSQLIINGQNQQKNYIGVISTKALVGITNPVQELNTLNAERDKKIADLETRLKRLELIMGNEKIKLT